VSVADELLESNAAYAAGFTGGLALRPARGLAVVACMDARLQIFPMLGLRPGDAHVIRNAGGIVRDEEIRSLTISQRLLGTSRTGPAASSPTSTRTSASRSPASGPRRSCPTATPCGGSCTTSRPAVCARSSDRQALRSV